MINPVEQMINRLDPEKKQKVCVILQEYENLRVQFAEDISKRSELLRSNESLQDETDRCQEKIEDNNARAETYLSKADELKEELEKDEANKAKIEEEITKCNEKANELKKSNESSSELLIALAQKTNENLLLIQAFNEKLNQFDSVQIKAKESLDNLGVKIDLDKFDGSFLHNSLAQARIQTEEPKPNKWQDVEKGVNNKDKQKPNNTKGSFLKPPEELEKFLNAKKFTFMPSDDKWTCMDNGTPKSNYTIENGKVSTTGRSDDALRNTIELYMKGEILKNKGVAPDFTKMEVLATGPDKDRMLELARKEYKIGTELNKKNTEQNTFGGGTPPTPNDQPPQVPFRPNF